MEKDFAKLIVLIYLEGTKHTVSSSGSEQTNIK
jgi:hypothetical protein